MVEEPAPSGPRGDARGARKPAAGRKAAPARGALARDGVLNVSGAPSPDPDVSMNGKGSLAAPPLALEQAAAALVCPPPPGPQTPTPWPRRRRCNVGVVMHVDEERRMWKWRAYCSFH